MNQKKQSDVKTTGASKLADIEMRDDATDRSVRPAVPQCRKCGETFSTESELVEHAKTCKGGHDGGQRPHFH
jgi:hypothetical protein